MRSIASFVLVPLILAPFACSSSKPSAAPLPSVDDFISDVRLTPSCALDCSADCKESESPWKCRALGAWSEIPHDPDACGGFDGKALPDVVKGSCVATDPTGAALAKTSFLGAPVVLPDGRRVTPAGTEWVFAEADLPGGFPATAALVPGTKWLVVSDDGYGVDAARVVDTTLLRAGKTNPVVSYARYAPPSGLSYGIAVGPTSGIVYAASGGHDAKVFAFEVDKTTGKIAIDAAKSVALPADTVAQGIAVSPDGNKLLVGQAKASSVFVYSLDPATYGKALGSIDVGAKDIFAVRFDPNDPAGNTAYATMWVGAVDPTHTEQMRLAQIDVAGKKAVTIPVGKSPEEIAFLDARYAVVANSLGDTLSVLDRPAGKIVSTVSVAPDGGPQHGFGPSAVAYDAPRKRLYAALSSVNGVGVFDVDLGGASPRIVPAGTFATAWWPTSVIIDPTDGAVYVTNGKGHGTGTDKKQRTFDDGEVASLMMGSVQAVPYLDAAALADASAKFRAASDVSKIPGYATVQCNGAPYDFPLPAKTADGPSTKIKHVFFIVRENKTFDDIFGDVPGLDGDPNLVMAPGHMEEIWPNTRKIGAEFAHMDNYYSDAEQSIQGHAWTVFGRSTDYTERRWVTIWGRHEFSPTQSPGVGDDTTPQEGNVFSALKAGGVGVENMGDLYAIGFRDLHWPGGTSDSPIPDTLGACYLAARARAACDTKEFTYVWLPNDHAFGLDAGKPNPALMVATNDEATGMLVDGISRSPIWKESLIVIVEDDPNTGGDHVDLHRSIALFASPWIKRGYVSHAHYDIASVHKIFAHVFGKPYWNETMATAALPLDLFTSTPDFSPFSYLPRRFKDLSCNPEGTVGAKEAEGWDFSEPDDQPGLSRQNWQALRSLK